MTIYIQNLERLIPPEVYASAQPAIIHAMVTDTAEAARAHWIKLAGKRLKTSRAEYLSGIQKIRREGDYAVISLVGKVPNLIEKGLTQAIDQRKFLLGANVPTVPRGQRGKHAVKNADGTTGYYRSIPFRHATPTASGVTGGPMGSQFIKQLGKKRAKDIGQAIYQEALKINDDDTDDPQLTRSMAKYGVSYGGRLPEKVTSSIAPKLKAIHSNDIYAGMIRSTKVYENAQQQQYHTFRTISTNSDPSKWIIPSRPGKRLAKDVVSYINTKVMPRLIDMYMEKK